MVLKILILSLAFSTVSAQAATYQELIKQIQSESKNFSSNCNQFSEQFDKFPREKR